MPPERPNPYVLPPHPERPHHPETNQVVEPQQPVVTSSDGPVAPDYGFITEPSKPPRKPLSLPSLGGNSSLPVRIAVVLGGLLTLIIIFAIAKSLFSGGGNTQALTAVAQQQQSMIHILSSSSSNSSTLSENDQNFAATANVTLTSAQHELVHYMAANGKKVKAKTLKLKISPSVDKQLTTAASDNTYDSTFKQVMQGQINTYEKTLRAAYQQTTGPKGRALLKDQFQGAQLLLTQLNSPDS